jgi:hexosaminidase
MRIQLFLIASVVLLAQCTPREKVALPGPVAIIPEPAQLQTGNGHFEINAQTVIQLATDTGNVAGVAHYLSELLHGPSSFEIPIKKVETFTTGHAIHLRLIQGRPAESYSVTVSPDVINLEASDAAGLFYAVQSLRQLLPAAVETKDHQTSTWTVPAVTLHDAPRYAWRGMHLDVSRHFFSPDFIRTFIDRMALYKFNTLHWHLTDDQGWRLEIKRYPRLTQAGAWRALNNQDSVCLEKAKTDPTYALPEKFFRTSEGQRQYGGFYTQAEVRDIIAYAQQRMITIVPEIDMPGHMLAAIQAVPTLTCTDESSWGKLFTTPLCPCEETTYKFIEEVLSEVAGLFPGPYLHIGADEVDEATWITSGTCAGMMKREGMKTARDLHGYFVNRARQIVEKLGKKAIGWDEVLDSNADTALTVMYWRGWVKDAPAKAVTKGHELIMSPTSHCYFDYQPDQTSLKHTYFFNPVPEGLTPEAEKRLKGLQANIWTEYIPTEDRLDFMTMPRMVALAEVAWSQQKDWDSFQKRMDIHYGRLDALGVHYRLPDIPDLPQHVVFTDTAHIALTIPNGITALRYTTDGTLPDSTATLYHKAFTLDTTATLKMVSYGAHGRAGNAYTIRYEKQTYLIGVTPANTKPGLACAYYPSHRSYRSVEKFLPADLKTTVRVPSVIIPDMATATDGFGLAFTGYVNVAEKGIYTFYLSSDDGSVLKIGDRLVVNNDGEHGDREIGGQVALDKGWHPINLRYFDGGGGKSLMLLYEGPDITKQAIPATALASEKP